MEEVKEKQEYYLGRWCAGRAALGADASVGANVGAVRVQ